MVSGLFHSPRRGAFHHSLTVLVHYRSSAVFSLGPWSAPLPARSRVSGGTHVRAASGRPTRRLRGSHPLRRPVPAAFGCADRSGRAACRPLPARRPTPSRQRRQPRDADSVWALPRSLAATEGILSFPRGTEMFQFPRCPPQPKLRRPAKRRAGCPIRKSRDHWLPAPPPGISPRGRVLPRPPTPRHPPCAHHRGRAAVRSPPPRRKARARPGSRAPDPRIARRRRMARRPIRTSPCPRHLVLLLGLVVVRDAVALQVMAGSARNRETRSAPPSEAARRQLSRCASDAGPGGWSRGDSNPGPPPCKGGALPAAPRPPAGGRAWTRTRGLGLIRAAL
jgi:hypothetical protein